MHGKALQLDFLAGGGEVGALMRAHDWSTSLLGTPEGWPQPLRTVVALMLGSQFPMFVAWGRELGFLYNDAYAEILGAKHPSALGARFAGVWSEIWVDISPLVDAALSGESTYREDLPLLVDRRGFAEQAWFTFSYSPVRDEGGAVAGMYCAVAETTGRVLAERAVRAERDRAQGVLGNMGEAFVLLDSEFRITDMNAEALRLDKRPKEDLLGKTHAEAYPDAAPELVDLYRRAMHELRAVSLQHRYVWPDGRDAWMDMRAYPSGGGLAVFYRDVTERVTAEQRLRESETRFRNMADQAPVMMWVTDPSGYCTYLNARWYEFTGQEPGQGEGYGWLEAVHPDDRATAEQAFVAANAERRNYRVDFRLRRADGVYRWTIDAAAARFTPHGEYLGYVGSVIDIEERKELEASLEQRVVERTAELSESQRRFQGIFHSALQFMALLTPDGMVVEVNQTALAWSQIEPSDIVGKPFWLAAPMRDNPALQSAVKAGIERAATGETVREEHEMRGAGEIRAAVDFSLKPVPGEDGKPMFLVAEGRDVTELKNAQEALRQSQKMEAMGQLTGGVAHDFNNLLTPIIGSLDMLMRRGLGNEREQRLVSGALQSAERAKTLVQRLLAFARRQPLQATAVDLPQLVTGMAGLIESTLGPNVDVRVELAGDLPPASADANQLEMALLNLAVNARDAMPGGGVLTIAAARESIGAGHPAKLKQGDYVRVSVSDTGAGMDAETRTRAIEPFFSTKGIRKGTGLGLSMVHGLAAQLGGGLMIESELGHGTSVKLWLPVSPEPLRSDDRQSVHSAVRTRGRALLVDDEELVRMSTADMLNDIGYEVIEAGSAEEALRLFDRANPPDLLVTDHLMPGMSGVELARHIRSLKADLPVLIVSGYAEVDGIAPDLPRLTKPFRNAELAERLAVLSL